MRVLHLAAGNLLGGVERLLVTLARQRNLAPQMTPAFGLSFRGPVWGELAAAGAELHDLGATRVRRPWTVWRARRRLAAVLRDRRFDAVLTHGGWPQALFAPVVRRTGTRLGFASHDALTRRGWVNRWAAHTRPDVVVANSRFTAGTVAAVFSEVPMEVVYPPVELIQPAGRAAARAELGIPADAVLVLHAARLERWKGAAELLEALARLRDVPGWVACFAGGPQKPGEAAHLAELTARAASLGVADRVRFLGHRADVPRLLAAADILCHPTTAPEPFGLAVAEALAAGVPVVASAAGGPAELIDPTCGVLVPPGDVAALADALRRLVADPVQRAKLSAGGPARAVALCDPAARLADLARVLRG